MRGDILFLTPPLCVVVVGDVVGMGLGDLEVGVVVARGDLLGEIDLRSTLAA